MSEQVSQNIIAIAVRDALKVSGVTSTVILDTTGYVNLSTAGAVFRIAKASTT